MAIYHLSVKIGSRTKGQSAIAAAAYRSGSRLTDHETGVVSDYTNKGGVVFSEIALCRNAPAAFADRQTLWDAVHEIEKNKNAQLWREFEVALPKELDRSQQIETVRAFVRSLTEQGMCADWSLHDKGDGNPHAHIMTTMRSIDSDGQWAAKSRKVYDLDEKGEKIFQKIDKSGKRQYKSHKEDYNNWNAKERVEEWRTAWEVCCNARLAEHDHIDHRSYERQGIDRIPTVHEGVVARKIAAEGGKSELIEKNNEIRRRNSLLQSLAAQFKAIGEKIKQLEDELTREREDIINAGKQRLSELFDRRSHPVNNADRGITDGERTVSESDTAAVLGEARAVGASADVVLAGTEADTEVIRDATERTNAVIAESDARVQSSTAERANRDAERKRQAALARKREIEAARKREKEPEAERSYGSLCR